MLTLLLLASAACLVVSQNQLCLGEYSTCAVSGACALIASTCSSCSAGQYVCPISNTCVASAAALSTCPGLANTHFDATLSVEARLDYIFSQQLTVDELVGQMTENASSIDRLSIPEYDYLNDDEHGVKQPDATAFPSGVALGASWNADLIFRVGNAIGVEARGVHNSQLDKTGKTGGEGWPGTLKNGASTTLYAPNMNLVHDIRWGRAQEVFSECPQLSGDLTAVYIQGLQNTTTETQTPLLSAACCKHFAVYNIETIPHTRTYFDAIVGARDLWETYLPVFEACLVRGASQTVMCSYNSLNGVPTCADPGLLTTVLRDTFNFTGFVVSDYDAWANIVETHAYVGTWGEAATVGLSAGMDQEGGGGPTYPPVQQGIPAALAVGNISMAQVDQAVRRLLRVRIRMGCFDPPTSVPYNYITKASVASNEHLALAEEAARQGVTLLRNVIPTGATTAALPLSLPTLKGKTIAILGPNANASYLLLGSYSDPTCCTVGGIPTILAELASRATVAQVQVTYAPGCVNASCLTTDGFAAAASAAASADAVVLVLGAGTNEYACGGNADKTACEAEAWDRPTCALPGGQPALVAAVKAALAPGVPLIGVFIHGGSYCLTNETINALDAILDSWYPGMRGGAATADALVGVYSPSGRSPQTWYASDAALPADRGEMSPYANPSTSSPGITYRFYDPDSVSVAPAPFTFGEGYSYTTFAASNVVAPSTVGPCDDIPVSVTITNTGSVISDVVVAVYLQQVGTSVPSPLTRLVTFARITQLAAGAKTTLALPPIPPTSRSVIHPTGGNATDIYSLPGKRWNEAGALSLRVSLGGHGEDRVGGLAFTVTQTADQDLWTC